MIQLTYLEVAVVGLIQGVTELFPVSSLGHNVLIPRSSGGAGRAISTWPPTSRPTWRSSSGCTSPPRSHCSSTSGATGSASSRGSSPRCARLKIPDLMGPLGNGIHGQVVVGSVLPGVGAYVSVKYLVRYFQTRTLTPFGIYCVIAGLARLAYLYLVR